MSNKLQEKAAIREGLIKHTLWARLVVPSFAKTRRDSYDHYLRIVAHFDKAQLADIELEYALHQYIKKAEKSCTPIDHFEAYIKHLQSVGYILIESYVPNSTSLTRNEEKVYFVQLATK
jgi:hypothetical protein